MSQGVLVMAVIAAVFLTIVMVIRALARRRTTAMAGVAASLGFTFEETADGTGNAMEGDPWRGQAYDSGFNLWSLDLFQRGHSGGARNILRGRTEAGNTYLFDWQYTTGSGRSTVTHVQTVAAYSLDSVLLPAFQLKRENVFEKIASAFGYQDIDFPSNPEFSHRYLLRSDDEEKVRRLFSPDLLRFFEEARLEGQHVEGYSRWLIVYKSESKCAPEKLSDRLAQVTPVATAVAQAARAARLA